MGGKGSRRGQRDNRRAKVGVRWEMKQLYSFSHSTGIFHYPRRCVHFSLAPPVFVYPDLFPPISVVLKNTFSRKYGPSVKSSQEEFCISALNNASAGTCSFNRKYLQTGGSPGSSVDISYWHMMGFLHVCLSFASTEESRVPPRWFHRLRSSCRCSSEVD